MPCIGEKGEAITIGTSKIENGCRPSVTFELHGYADTESVLQELLKTLEKTCEQFRVVKKYIEKGGAQRGVLIYTYRDGNAPLVTEKVILPLPERRVLTMTATAAHIAWKEYAKLFQSVITSVRSVGAGPCPDVEIVFAPDRPLQKAETKSAAAQAVSAKQDEGAAFAEFAAKFDRQWKTCLIQGDLREMTGDEGLARVLWAALGSRVKSWVSDPIPALQGKTALQCFATPGGRRQLRTILLQLNDRADNLLEILAKKQNIEAQLGSDPLQLVSELLRTPAERRDEHWYGEFRLGAFWAHFFIPDRPISLTPAGYPFFWLYTFSPNDYRGGRRLRVTEIIEEATERGAGLMFAAADCEPWTCTFGTACHLRVHGDLFDPGNAAHRPTLNKSLSVAGSLLGSPTEQVLPSYARRAIKAFMQEKFGVQHPAVVMDYNSNEQCQFTLVFNLYDGNIRTEEAMSAAIEAMFWFVPPLVNVGASSRQERRLPFGEL